MLKQYMPYFIDLVEKTRNDQKCKYVWEQGLTTFITVATVLLAIYIVYKIFNRRDQ